MEILSRVHATNLVRWAKDKPEVLVLSADLTSSTEIDLFRDAYPDRFLSMGVAEQNMLSFAGGLAREGFFPFVHTFAVFIYRRAYDQIAMSVAYPNLPVRMFGFLPGVTSPSGASHQAIEDIALMRGAAEYDGHRMCRRHRDRNRARRGPCGAGPRLRADVARRGAATVCRRQGDATGQTANGR